MTIVEKVTSKKLGQDPAWMQKLARPEVRKKATTLVVSALLLVVNDIFDLGIDRETIVLLVGLAGTYMLGQGLADMGKERAIIQARAGTAEHMELDVDVDYMGAPVAPMAAVTPMAKARRRE